MNREQTSGQTRKPSRRLTWRRALALLVCELTVLQPSLAMAQLAQVPLFTVTSVPLCIPGVTYSWAFTNNTSGATFCSATNLATVCVNPGPNAGSFTLESTVANVTGSVVPPAFILS